MHTIKLHKLQGNDDLPLPEKMSDMASGFDIVASITEDTAIDPGQRLLIPTGFSIEMQPGLEAQVRPRSGLALKFGITCLNTPGTIDADYRGEIKVLLINLGQQPFIIRRGDRIAQLVFQLVPPIEWVQVEKLDQTDRGTGGFGHTGM